MAKGVGGQSFRAKNLLCRALKSPLASRSSKKVSELFLPARASRAEKQRMENWIKRRNYLDESNFCLFSPLKDLLRDTQAIKSRIINVLLLFAIRRRGEERAKLLPFLIQQMILRNKFFGACSTLSLSSHFLPRIVSLCEKLFTDSSLHAESFPEAFPECMGFRAS